MKQHEQDSEQVPCKPQTLEDWVNRAQVDSGKRLGVSSEMAARMTAVRRDTRELFQTQEILRQDFRLAG